jgi:peptidoglycan/LPS O-acetylase OafA/YrhL
VEPLVGFFALGTLVSVHALTFLGNPDQRVWAPSVVGLSLCVFLGVGIRGRWLESKVGRVLVDPGQVSYAAYLFHPLVLFLGWSAIRGQTMGVAYALLAALTIGCAYGVFYGYERPLNRRVRGLLIREVRSVR